MKSSDYDTFGEAYAEHSSTSPFNALYDRPAILDLVGDVTGLRVLDIGCATGLLSRQLAERGANVLGLDASEVMIREAEHRHGQHARFRHADLAEPLDFLPNDSVDVVTASLVLHYLRDWGPTLQELHRVLVPGGAFVLSVHHSDDSALFADRDYFATELITETWHIAGHPEDVSFYRRPLSATFSALRQGGFLIDELAEPMPVPEAAQSHPEAYRTLTTQPHFLYFRTTAEQQGSTQTPTTHPTRGQYGCRTSSRRPQRTACLVQPGRARSHSGPRSSAGAGVGGSSVARPRLLCCRSR